MAVLLQNTINYILHVHISIHNSHEILFLNNSKCATSLAEVMKAYIYLSKAFFQKI